MQNNFINYKRMKRKFAFWVNQKQTWNKSLQSQYCVWVNPKTNKQTKRATTTWNKSLQRQYCVRPPLASHLPLSVSLSPRKSLRNVLHSWTSTCSSSCIVAGALGRCQILHFISLLFKYIYTLFISFYIFFLSGLGWICWHCRWQDHFWHMR